MYTCDVMIYNKKCIFDLIFILISGTEFLKPLEFLKEWEWQRCLLLSGDFQTLTSRWGWMPEEPTMWLDSWNFQSFPLTPNLPGKRGGLDIEFSHQWPWFNQSCLRNGASIETQKRELRELLGCEHVEVLGDWHARRGHGRSMPLPHTLPYASVLSGCSCIISFYNILVI